MKIVNCINEECPLPLVKTREAIMNSKKGEIIEVKGTHQKSFDEIIMSLDALGIKILKSEKKREWYIKFKL